MKQNRILSALVTTALLWGLSAVQAETLLLKAKPGSKVQIDGTSTVHDWMVQGKLIGGSVSIDGDFPTEPGQTAPSGPVDATVRAFVPISSLKSYKDGKPYSTKMDEIMQEKLGKPAHKHLVYELDELILNESPEAANSPFLYDAKGRLIVAGVTNAIELQVEVTPQADGKVKFATKTSLKMTDYGIEPPAPKVALGMIKTGDEVQIGIEWMTAKAPAK